MLKLKYLYENYDLAKLALRHWPHDTDNLDAMLARFRISANAVYPFTRDGAVCFLRLAPILEKQPGGTRAELAFISYLLEAGYPALRPIPARDGQALQTLDTPWGNYEACAFESVAGVPVEVAGFAPPVMAAYGEALGTLHNLSASYAPQEKRWSHQDALAWAGGVLREYGAGEATLAEHTAVGEALAALPKAHYGLVHYDFEPDNVFYDAQAGRCAVIDFDACMYHWYALDIERVLRALKDELSEQALAGAEQAFLAGYRAARPLPPDWEAVRPLMRRFINLYGYARLIRCVSETLPDEPQWLVQLRVKLGRVIAALEAGWQV